MHSETITKSRSLIFSVLRNFPVHEGIFKIFDSTEVFDQRGSILIHTNDKTHTLLSIFKFTYLSLVVHMYMNVTIIVEFVTTLKF